ncbi:hypothetical protein AAFF_G00034200 [Aldrovandia affinis]|uniref:Uncharacterized protein n=1 Tax=Aldrovandia affinis TaxID=143900 RepID=A0AAD7WFT1_9TELE|nr:hypothetical protein AAFF_G00034200 [Aldrovandia affinis]
MANGCAHVVFDKSVAQCLRCPFSGEREERRRSSGGLQLVPAAAYTVLMRYLWERLQSRASGRRLVSPRAAHLHRGTWDGVTRPAAAITAGGGGGTAAPGSLAKKAGLCCQPIGRRHLLLAFRVLLFTIV